MRTIYRNSTNNVINSVYTEHMLRDVSRKGRHTIMRPIRTELGVESKRMSASMAFKKFTREIVPKIEQDIELRLLFKFTEGLNEYEKEEIYDSYQMRRDNIRRALLIDEKVKDPDAPPPKGIKTMHAMDSILDWEGQGLSYHTFDAIGKTTVFPEGHWKRMYPSLSPGKWDKHHEKGGLYGVATPEEGLRLTYDLARLTTSAERDIDYDALLKTNANMKEILKQEKMFTTLYQDFSLEFRNMIMSCDKSVQHYFESPSIFDALVTIVLLESKKPSIRPYVLKKESRTEIFRQLIEGVVDISRKEGIRLREFRDLAAHWRTQEINLSKSLLGEDADQCKSKKDEFTYRLVIAEYQKYGKHFWRPPTMRDFTIDGFKGFNSNFFLHGDGGAGKSGVSAYVTAWAHENDWVVVSIPQGRHWCRTYFGKYQLDRHPNGLYIQPGQSLEFLKDLLYSNEKNFGEMKVDLERYGKCDQTGFNRDNGEPCPRVWDDRRKTWSDDWKQFIGDFEKKMMDQKLTEYNQIMSTEEYLPKPETLAEIAQYGIDNPQFATNALGEIMEQLYNQEEKKVLVAIDQYNDWFRPSEFRSFRYANENRYYIPPYDLSLVRMFMNFDGHFIKNGFKLMTSSSEDLFASQFDHTQIGFPTGFHQKMNPLRLNDIRHLMNYNMLSNIVPRGYAEWEIESLYMEGQGNPGLLLDSCEKTKHLQYV